MEKQAAIAGQKGWLWPAVRTQRPTIGSTLAASLWPCGIFARTSRRLKAVRSGQDAEHIAVPGIFSPECAICLTLCPAFGCLVGSLQTKARALYGIDGNACSDQCDGIFCPCFTMVRVEQEILFREEQRKRLVESPRRPYQRHDSMTYLSPESAMTKPSSKETPSSLDTTAATRSTTHSLDNHQVMTAGNVRPRHGIEADATIASLPKTTASGHHVCRDPVTIVAHTPASHDLSADTTTYFVNLDYDHNLGRDVLASSSTGRTIVGHGLPAHKPSQVSTTRPAHQLSDDATVLPESRSGTGHVLDEHGEGDTANKETGAKHMADDDATATATATATVNEVEPSKAEEKRHVSLEGVGKGKLDE
ncbi:hypothetical protein E4U54_001500 [Claviceps lovelessii]|nr:hypothetical protein E4U54_001500 [Claviceps lovelessii]